MPTRPDPVAQQVEAFHQRLTQGAYMHQQWLKRLAADRLRRDLELLRQPCKPPPSFLHRVKARLTALHDQRQQRKQPLPASEPTIIDATCVDVTDNQHHYR